MQVFHPYRKVQSLLTSQSCLENLKVSYILYPMKKTAIFISVLLVSFLIGKVVADDITLTLFYPSLRARGIYKAPSRA